MVKIVESYEQEPGIAPPLEFKVYLSPRDGKSVLGRLTPVGAIDSAAQQATFVFTPFGVPVHEAFEQAISLAERCGIEALWVNDPDGLFPRQS